MLVILKRDSRAIHEQAAQLIASAIKKKPTLALGLATGSTMVGVYESLVRLHKAGAVDFSKVVTFNLDEYLGPPASHPQSFHYFMQEHFFVTSMCSRATFIFPTAASTGPTINNARRTNKRFALRAALTFSSWASAAQRLTQRN